MAPQTPKRSSGFLSSKSSKKITTFLPEKQGRNSNVTQKQLKPLLSVSRPPVFGLGISPSVVSASTASNSSKGKAKDKGKAKEKVKAEVISLLDESGESVVEDIPVHVNDSLWVDRYEPRSEAELAVHKRKVEDVRGWLQEALCGGQSGTLRKYRRILVLTGPAGSAKTATIRVLSREIGFEISEWRSSAEESYSIDVYDHESNNIKFETFLARAGSCNSVLAGSSVSLATSHSQTKRVVLLEDLPNILHQPTQESFHEALRAYCAEPDSAPLIIIISDAPVRGDVKDERITFGGNRGSSSAEQTIDIRTTLPQHLINSPYVTQISFNPIAPTLMLRALQELLARHISEQDTTQNKRPTKDDLNIIVETSNGDIRSAVMTLQFCCIYDSITTANGKKRTTKGKGKDNVTGAGKRALMEAMTRREQALALFHLMGKVLYNKRKGDPSSTSASAKERLREQETDARIKDPEQLPIWLSHHERRASRLDVNMLYADSPIDSSLYSLYLHQNYVQFCNGMDECEELCDWLSWIDSNGGEQWYHANPYRFHLLTLGTLHSLPSPVTRRSQKIFKPVFFDILKKTRRAEDAVYDVWRWLQGDAQSVRWGQEEVTLEVGAVLKARTGGKSETQLPPSHTAFSIMAHANPDILDLEVLADENNNEYCQSPALDENTRGEHAVMDDGKGDGGNWLESDDIEDF